MKVIYWNARGVANYETRLVIKRMISSNRPDFFFISEPWISLNQFPVRFWSKLNTQVSAVNDRGAQDPNLWCICNCSVTPTVIAVSSQ